MRQDMYVFRLGQDGRLRRETRRTIIMGDNNMLELVVKVPTRLAEKDVSGYAYEFRFEVDGAFRTKNPTVNLMGDYIEVSTYIDDTVTRTDRSVRFSIAGESVMEGLERAFHSRPTSLQVGHTIMEANYCPDDVEGAIYETMKDYADSLMGEIGDEVTDKLRDLIAQGSLNNYNNLENKPRIEGVTVEHDKTFEDYGLIALTAQDIRALL